MHELLWVNGGKKGPIEGFELACEEAEKILRAGITPLVEIRHLPEANFLPAREFTVGDNNSTYGKLGFFNDFMLI